VQPITEVTWLTVHVLSSHGARVPGIKTQKNIKKVVNSVFSEDVGRAEPSEVSTDFVELLW